MPSSLSTLILRINPATYGFPVRALYCNVLTHEGKTFIGYLFLFGIVTRYMVSRVFHPMEIYASGRLVIGEMEEQFKEGGIGGLGIFNMANFYCSLASLGGWQRSPE